MNNLNRCFYIAIMLFFSPLVCAKTHIIKIENNYFNHPDQLNILVGDTIKFENQSNKPLALNFEYTNFTTYNPANFNSNIFHPGSSFEHTFVNAAQFHYSDTSNTDLKGGIGVYEKPLLISPRDSTLLGKKELNVTVFYQYTSPMLPIVTVDQIRSHIALTLDKKIIYDGDFDTFLKSTLVSEVGDTDAGLSYFVITAPKNSLPPGLHTFQVQSKDSSILYDEVHYTIN